MTVANKPWGTLIRRSESIMHPFRMTDGEWIMQWEYLVVDTTLDSGGLGKLGAEGWELVAVVSPAHFVLHYFFKREARA
jgi:hypothetical protein